MWRGRLTTPSEEPDVPPPATMGSVTELGLAVDICERGCIQCLEGKYFEVKTGNKLEKGEYETI